MIWNRLAGEAFLDPVVLSLKVSAVSSIIAFILAVAAARLMARRTFNGKTLLETCFMLPLVLPPSVIGFILLLLLGRSGWIGALAERVLGHSLLFTWQAAVIASTVVAFPLAYQTIKVGFASVDKELEDTARCQGARESQVMLYITLPLAGRSLIAAFILGLARSLGEFGATLMIAGNIPGKTQTMSTAIYLAVDSGELLMAWLWVICLILISFIMLWAAGKKS